MAINTEKTGAFDASSLQQGRCPACGGLGELRIDSENITEDFEVEKQTVITQCTACNGTGMAPAR